MGSLYKINARNQPVKFALEFNQVMQSQKHAKAINRPANLLLPLRNSNSLSITRKKFNLQVPRRNKMKNYRRGEKKMTTPSLLESRKMRNLIPFGKS